MAKKRKHRKGSRAANLMIRMRAITNGMREAKPTSPVFVMANDRIQKALSSRIRPPPRASG